MLAWEEVGDEVGRQRDVRQRTPPLPPLATAVTTLGPKSRAKTIRFLSALVCASRLLAFFIGTVAEIWGLGWLPLVEQCRRRQPG